MKVVKLYFEDGSKKLVSAADTRIRRVRAPDDVVVGDICRFSAENCIIYAEIIEVHDIDVGTTVENPNQPLSSLDQTILSELEKLRADIRNDVVNQIHRMSTAPFTPRIQPVVTPEIHELFPVENSTVRQPKRSGQFTPYQLQLANRRSESRESDYRPSRKTKFRNIKYSFPSQAHIRVRIPDGSYVSLESLSYDILVKAFEAKWSGTKFSFIAHKINISHAVKHLSKLCIEAFSTKNTRAFMYPISCYLFDMDVLRKAFLSGTPSVFYKGRIKRISSHKRQLNAEAQSAFFFLVDYFSTIVMKKCDTEHALWPAVVRNAFNNSVCDLIRKERFGPDDLPYPSTNNFLPYVIAGHEPVFNCRTAF